MMRRLAARALLFVLLLAAAAPDDGPRGIAVAADTVATWRLEPSDFVRYARCSVSPPAKDSKDGKEVLGAPEIATIHGFDLRDDGEYAPVVLLREDLPQLFAFRLAETTDRDFRITGIVPFKVRGSIEPMGTRVGPDGAVRKFHATYTFASGGVADKGDSHRIRDGRAEADLEFDPAEGVVARARVRLSYVLDKVERDRGDKPQTVAGSSDFARVTLKRCRYDEFQADVDQAIDRGVAHLRTLQKDDGTFAPYGGYPIGSTALGAYTLASCGASLADPQLERALAQLLTTTPEKTYDRAVALMAFERAYTPEGERDLTTDDGARALRRDLPPDRRAWCERVAAAIEKSGPQLGSWGYPTPGRVTPNTDSSNTQYAALGLHAASRMNIPVAEATWLGLIRHFEMHHEKDGPKGQVSILEEGHAIPRTGGYVPTPVDVQAVAGFNYSVREPRVWGSMTCAGIGSIAIARHELLRMKAKSFGMKDQAAAEQLILGGWAWLDRHWGVDRHPLHPGGEWYYYWLYALERAGILTNVLRVGNRDWYFDGAMEILARQKEDGSWDERGGNEHTTETCFALLFLKRATAPITGK
ncbi:MAG: hypothetical protein K8T90_10780 [Planctomycetes bacterium]|nr:hypothetical protein [Planctomycetota bacterium]